jgi:hypothetical protein
VLPVSRVVDAIAIALGGGSKAAASDQEIVREDILEE